MPDTQREIKFRIWDKQLKVFLYQLPEKHHLDWERFNVQQFTGLSDRLGKEIYEGDILRVLYTNWPSQLDKFPELSHEEYLDSLSIVGVVVFSGDRFLIDFNKGYGTRSIFEGKHGFKKIIGNIYENSELTKKD